MSSLYTGGDWSHATDGNTDGDWYDGGCASTDRDTNPWLLLDLGDTYTVGAMRIYNRVDGTVCKYYEPPRGKTNNVVSEQVRHKPTCTSTERS